MRVEQINNRVADHNKWLDELQHRSVRPNDYATPEEQAGRIAGPDQLLQERLGTPNPAVEPVKLHDFDLPAWQRTCCPAGITTMPPSSSSRRVTGSFFALRAQYFFGTALPCPPGDRRISACPSMDRKHCFST
jgi:hypothetical protein